MHVYISIIDCTKLPCKVAVLQEVDTCYAVRVKEELQLGS